MESNRPRALVYAEDLARARACMATPPLAELLEGYDVEPVSPASHLRARGRSVRIVVAVDPMTPAAAESIVPATFAGGVVLEVRR